MKRKVSELTRPVSLNLHLDVALVLSGESNGTNHE